MPCERLEEYRLDEKENGQGDRKNDWKHTGALKMLPYLTCELKKFFPQRSLHSLSWKMWAQWFIRERTWTPLRNMVNFWFDFGDDSVAKHIEEHFCIFLWRIMHRGPLSSCVFLWRIMRKEDRSCIFLWRIMRKEDRPCIFLWRIMRKEDRSCIFLWRIMYNEDCLCIFCEGLWIKRTDPVYFLWRIIHKEDCSCVFLWRITLKEDCFCVFLWRIMQKKDHFCNVFWGIIILQLILKNMDWRFLQRWKRRMR